MRGFIFILLVLLSYTGCKRHQANPKETEDSIKIELVKEDFSPRPTPELITGKRLKSEPVISETCNDFAYMTYTPEEAAHWDSMNADGGYLLIRGAERVLDTIVNHIHIVFITEP